MVKQRHIQILLIPGALLFLAFATSITPWIPTSNSHLPRWQPSSDIRTEIMFGSYGLEIPGEITFNSDSQTRFWRETLSPWYGFSVPDSTIPAAYHLIAADVPGSSSFILYAIGWFQAASP